LELCDWKSGELAATIADDEEVDAAEGKPVGNLVLEAIAIVSDVVQRNKVQILTAW
jgi:hypothetical protein